MFRSTSRLGLVAAGVGALLALSAASASASDIAGPAPEQAAAVLSAPGAADGLVSPLSLGSQAFSGSFKASLRSRTFYPKAKGTISAWVQPGNCTPGYGSITVDVYNVTVLTQVISYGKQSVPCSTGGYVSWANAYPGAYQLQFDRTGPAGKDENTKTVTGTIYFQN